MNVKITLSFEAEVIERAKALCDELGISLSRFTEIVYLKALEHGKPFSIEDLPVSDWVSAVAEDQATYISKKKSGKQLRDEFFESRK
jgi:antitoxin component of RelBE/YafQ-DinJ toxin-antitoxin module